MVKIRKIKAKEILDSRGKPTIEVELTTDFDISRASVPAGTSKGKFEAEIKDAKTAIKNINEFIGPKIIGKSTIYQKRIDNFLIKLDGTKNKSRLGANATLAVSIAVLRAGAKAQKLSLWKWISNIAGVKPRLPLTSILLIEGGLHGKGGSDVQEFMIVASLSLAEKIYQKLKKYKFKTGLEGGFIVPLKNTEKILDLILKTAGKEKVKIILDIAASHGCLLKTPAYYLNLIKHYPILGIEDPFPENDWRNWQKLSSKLLIIGDDLTVTNVEKIKEAYKKKACNAVVIKPNQIGTVSETIAAAKLAKSFNWKIMVSHRSGETMDDFIADLAVGIGADFIKAGAPSKPERMAKYNRLLNIEKELYMDLRNPNNWIS